MSNLFNKVILGRQFNFQPIEFANEAGYHVDVKDEEDTRWEFRIFRSGSLWKIEAEKIPGWIQELEPELGKAIEDHE